MIDAQPLLPPNNPNESKNPDPNQQQFNQIQTNAVNMGQVQPQVLASPQQPMQSFILPPQIDYSQYSNISQLNHMKINQPDNNTFIITKTGCEKIIPIIFAPIFLIITIAYIGIAIHFGSFDFYVIFFGILILPMDVLFAILLFIYQHTISFILGSNDITVKEKTWLRTKITNYLPGQLVSAQLICTFSQQCQASYLYKFNFILNNNGNPSEKIYFEEAKPKQIYTPEEMGYFNYVMNKHIQSKMTVNN